NRLHGPLYYYFPPGGVHSDPPDGRHFWAAVPGIRCHPGGRGERIVGGLPHHHPDAVCLPPARPEPRGTRLALSRPCVGVPERPAPGRDHARWAAPAAAGAGATA